MFNNILLHSPLLYLLQPLWRDEVFSVFFAAKSIPFIITKSSFDPPFYYILLHYWMKIFGQGEIAVRSFSLLGFALALVIVVRLSEQLFKKMWIQRIVPILFFLNPMLLYYAFEARAYGWYMFFTMGIVASYLNARWLWFSVFSILGFYTHEYVAIVPFVCAIHYILVHRKKILSVPFLIKDQFIRSLLTIGLFVLPWLIWIATSVPKFQTSWYFPVDWHLIKSVLGNLYVGYEGTPWYGWGYTHYLSLFLLLIFAISLIPKSQRIKSGFFVLLIFLPLSIVIGFSFFEPIYVNRYLTAVTIAEVFSIGFALASLRQKIIQIVLVGILLLFNILMNIWYPQQHMKSDYRTPMKEINSLIGPNDVIYVESPLVLFEAKYYAQNPTRVFLFNPANGAFPWYVGDAIVEPNFMRTTYPSYPTRAFVLHEDQTYSIAYDLPLINHQSQAK